MKLGVVLWRRQWWEKLVLRVGMGERGDGGGASSGNISWQGGPYFLYVRWRVNVVDAVV